MILTNNIDLLRIPLNGEKIQYLPKNTNFENRKIGRIFVLGGMRDNNIRDPYSNKQLIAFSEYNNIMLTLLNKSGDMIVNNVPLVHYILNQDSTKCLVNDYIDWENSFVNLLTADTLNNAEELLMYVTYDDVYTDTLTYSRVKKITIPAFDVNEPVFKKLNYLIDDYNLGKLIKIELSNPNGWSGELWMRLYDTAGRNIDYLNGNILTAFSGYFDRANAFWHGSYQYAQLPSKNNSLLFNRLNVDWERSEVLNLSQTDSYDLTFYFE